MTIRILLSAVFAGSLLVQGAIAADWIVAPSYYTHDPATGERVSQYSPIGPFYTYARADFQRSGYRHTRSSLQAGHSADNLHVVEEWGRPVRPYGEWRFPYRPYSVPYLDWGAPFAGLNQPGWWGPSMGMPFSGAPNAGAGTGLNSQPYSRQQPPPYYDGSYPRYRTRPTAPWPQRGGHGHGGREPSKPATPAPAPSGGGSA